MSSLPPPPHSSDPESGTLRKFMSPEFQSQLLNAIADPERRSFVMADKHGIKIRVSRKRENFFVEMETDSCALPTRALAQILAGHDRGWRMVWNGVVLPSSDAVVLQVAPGQRSTLQILAPPQSSQRRWIALCFLSRAEPPDPLDDTMYSFVIARPLATLSREAVPFIPMLERVFLDFPLLQSPLQERDLNYIRLQGEEPDFPSTFVEWKTRLLEMQPVPWLRSQIPEGDSHPSIPVIPKYLDHLAPLLPSAVKALYGQGQEQGGISGFMGRLLQDFVSALESSGVDRHLEMMARLLLIEELHVWIHFKSYDLFHVGLEHHVGPFHWISVPGVGERAPPLHVGAEVTLVSVAGDVPNPYLVTCYIHEVRQDQVAIVLPRGFPAREDMRFHVRFHHDWLRFRTMHRAVSWALSGREPALVKEVLRCAFPPNFVWRSYDTDALPPIRPPSDGAEPIRLFGSTMNRRQIAALRHAVDMDPKAPLLTIVQGPIGCGKTKVAVELILQHCAAGRRVLVTAPSEFPADDLTRKLGAHLTPDTLLQLNVLQRHTALLPGVERFCRRIGRWFIVPEDVAKYRVIVGSLAALGSAVGQQNLGEFSVLVVDEAAQALLPEMIVAIRLLASGSGPKKICLLGDPYQIGPHVESPQALACGFGHSLQTLITMHSPHLVVHLDRNYRSHEYLLQIPSKFFYHGDLEVLGGDRQRTHSMASWPGLPHPGWPMLFVGVDGPDEFDHQKSSLMNRSEIEAVIRLVKALLDTGEQPGSFPSDSPPGGKAASEDLEFYKQPTVGCISVITPFRWQVLEMRRRLREEGLPGIHCGTVDDFQGQESRIVIISTVQSHLDSRPQLEEVQSRGLFRNPRRFNVAVTRAIAMTCVVGNPFILPADARWNALLLECIAKGNYVGCPLPRQFRALLPQAPAQGMDWLWWKEPGEVEAKSNGSPDQDQSGE